MKEEYRTGEVCFHGAGLVGWDTEDVREATSGVNHAFGGFFGLGYGGAWLDLGSADGSNV